MILKSTPLLGVLLLIGSALTAQVDLSGDMPFFERKAQTYQRWLQKHQLTGLMNVAGVQLSEDGARVELLLHLNAAKTDYAAGLWTAMQTSYRPVPGTPTIEESLFKSFVRFFEIERGQGNIQLFIPPPADGSYRDPCFHLWIEAPYGQVTTRNRMEMCKAVYSNIELHLPPICTEGASTSAVHTRGTSDWVFANVLDFAQRKYAREKINCEERYPNLVKLSQSGGYLEFFVTDLCQEVLTHERQSLWCDLVEVLGGSCNDTRRERLEFRIHIDHPSEDTFQLTVELTGKFGSGVYMPRRSGWIDMDPDFEDDFLVPHARRFEQELVAYLTRP